MGTDDYSARRAADRRSAGELLRVTLLDRSTHHVAIIRAGRACHEHAVRVLAELDRASSRRGRLGAVRLGSDWLLPTRRARDTLERHPS